MLPDRMLLLLLLEEPELGVAISEPTAEAPEPVRVRSFPVRVLDDDPLES